MEFRLSVTVGQSKYYYSHKTFEYFASRPRRQDFRRWTMCSPPPTPCTSLFCRSVCMIQEREMFLMCAILS